jgi:hypothetical protein
LGYDDNNHVQKNNNPLGMKGIFMPVMPDRLRILGPERILRCIISRSMEIYKVEAIS